MNPAEHATNGAPADAKVRELEEENIRLRASLANAEQRLQKLQEERDDYHAVALLWMREHCSEAAWADFHPDDYTGTMDELIAHTEAMLKK